MISAVCEDGALPSFSEPTDPYEQKETVCSTSQTTDMRKAQLEAPAAH